MKLLTLTTIGALSVFALSANAHETTTPNGTPDADMVAKAQALHDAATTQKHKMTQEELAAMIQEMQANKDAAMAKAQDRMGNMDKAGAAQGMKDAATGMAAGMSDGNGGNAGGMGGNGGNAGGMGGAGGNAGGNGGGMGGAGGMGGMTN